jgi:phage shock protein A
MFDWLRRLFGIAKAETNAALDKLEDPIKMSEQGIRDLKNDLNKSLQSLAEVKAMQIRSKKELEVAKNQESDYENKAILLLQRAERGEIAPEEADRLATMALDKKEQAARRVLDIQKNVDHYDPLVKKMEVNVQKLKEQISNWDNELKTLKARAKVSEATAKLNKQMAQIDSTDTMAMLEKMKEKVAAQEALAESYGEMADLNTSVDDEINKALGPSSSSVNSEALARLKAKMAASKPSGESHTDSGPASSQSANDGSGEPNELDKLKQKLRDSQ